MYILRRPFILILILYGVGLLVSQRHGLFETPASQDPRQWEGRPAAVTGIVVSHPDLRLRGCVYVLECETVEEFGRPKRIHSAQGRTLLHIIKGRDDFAAPGDRLRAVGRVQKPRTATVPETFDYGAYLKTKGIFSVIYTSPKSVENLGPSGAYRWMAWGWALRQKTIGIFKKHLPEKEAAVLAGLVVGARPRFYEEIKRIFVESGTMHVLVASGSNVAFVVGLWFLLARLVFRLSRMLALGSALPMVWLYALVVGADAPIVRASIMATIAILYYLLAREPDPYQALALAALAILIPSPRTFFDVGFQMSFITVFGMIYTLPALDPWVPSDRPVWRRLTQIAFATWMAQLWLFPLTAHVFKRFFPISLVANLVTLPLAAWGLPSGLSLIAADACPAVFPFSYVLTAVQWATRVYLSAFIQLVAFFARVPGLSFWFTPPHALWIVGFYLCCFSLVGLVKSWAARVGFVMGLVLIITGHMIKSRSLEQKHAFHLTWLDTGRTVSVLIQTNEGRAFLVNPGPLTPVDSSERILLPYFASQSIGALEAVFITHKDPKQAAGLKTLETAVDISSVVICTNQDPIEWKKWARGNRKAPVRFLREGQSVQWDNLSLTPLPGSKRFSQETPVLIQLGTTSVVLAGTLSLETQDALMKGGLKALHVLQARFPQRLLWYEDFISRYKPLTIVDTGYDSPAKPSAYPWKKARVVKPQKLGLWRWEN